jgi:7,8-dihydropterin-6-yl-methyl-4-(beta-D-ribofuranosyl)aminobenzene 5'-phosphate synthase
MPEIPELRKADKVEVTVLVDNYADMLVPSKGSVARRPPFSATRTLLAEHGLSVLVRVVAGKKAHEVLMDAGLSAGCMLHNARQLGYDLREVEAMVLSHGHYDHTGGLYAFLEDAGRQVPLIVHPDAFLRRRRNNPAAGPIELPKLDTVVLKKAGADILMRKGPSTLAAGHLLVSGEIKRTVPFEKEHPNMEVWADGRWLPDRIMDDQALVINVRDKGLVVISGCAHAGIINTVEYARKVTGTDHVHAIMGGFHLPVPIFEPVIGPTIDAMQRIGPDYIVPMHCTGWNAIGRFMAAMPEQCILNTVGTKYIF